MLYCLFCIATSIYKSNFVMKKRLFIYVLGLLPFVGFGQNLYTISSSQSPYPYWIYLPDNYNADSGNNWPLMVFLHGRSLSGTDLNLVKRYGLIAEVRKGRSFPAVIVAPQVRKGQFWQPDSVVKCIQSVIASNSIDTNRISVTGMSLGGYGTLHTAGKFPEMFCAAAAFCGGGKTADGCRLSTIPVWIAHGKRDEAVPFRESVVMANAIRECNDQNLRFTEFGQLNHGALERMFRTEELYEFLLGNSKGSATFFPDFQLNTIQY